MVQYMRFIFFSPLSDNIQKASKLVRVSKDITSFIGEEHTISSLGDPFFSNDVTESGILKYLEHIESQLIKGVAEPVVLSDKTREVKFCFSTNNVMEPSFESIWFSFHPNSAISMPTLELAGLVRKIFNSFEARYAFSEEELLMEAYFSRSNYSNALKKIPESLQSYLPKPDLERLAGYNLPFLESLSHSYPWKMPNGIWWCNCLNKEQIDLLGRETLFSFDWFLLEPLNQNDYLFILTEAPLDIQNQLQLDKLKKLLEELKFAQRQKLYY
jgi:hypothetical protein